MLPRSVEITTRIASSMLILNAILVAAWLCSSPIHCCHASSTPQYDEHADTSTYTVMIRCFSGKLTAWQFFFVAENALGSALRCFRSYQLLQLHLEDGHIGFLAAGTINAAGMLCASILLLLILDKPFNQQMTFGFILPVSSLLSALSLLIPDVQKSDQCPHFFEEIFFTNFGMKIRPSERAEQMHSIKLMPSRILVKLLLKTMPTVVPPNISRIPIANMHWHDCEESFI